MRWFDGSIDEAIATTKTKEAIFVVYIEGKDEASKRITQDLDDADVSALLATDDFVAIKVEAGSVPHRQFEQIYQNVPLPSIFFIGRRGTALELATEANTKNVSDLKSHIELALQKHGSPDIRKTEAPQPKEEKTEAKPEEKIEQKSEGEVEQKPEETVEQKSEGKVEEKSEEKVEQKSEEKVERKSEIVCENGVCYKKPVAEGASSSKVENDSPPSGFETSSPTPPKLEEKVEYAKELLEKKREQKEMEEKEKERQKEIERRKVGQEVQKLKRRQQEDELKQIVEERQRLKQEEQIARQRVLAQIAQDKADRAARFNPQPSPSSSGNEDRPSPTVNSNIARLQFRLPDGTSHTHNFDPSDLLQDVRDYITANLNLPYRNFVLSTTFPRREFTGNDDSQNLRDLQLCPNAVILILPVNSGVITTTQGGLMSFVWSFLAPFLGILGYVRSFVYGRPQEKPSTAAGQTKRSADNSGESSESAKRRIPDSTVIRRQGNVHRLHDRREDDDDNNTWNGNSTQQM